MVLALLNPGHAQLEMGGGKEKRAAREYCLLLDSPFALKLRSYKKLCLFISKTGRARSTQSRDDEDDMMSVAGGDLASVLGESDGEEESGLDNAYLLEEAVEKLYNKRGSTRLQGLRALINMLQMSILANELEHQAATVSELCLKSIRHGGTEMTLAAQCLSLLHLQVPEACQDAYEEVRTELRHLVHGMSGEPTPLISCLRTLTLICYVCGNDMVDLEETLLDLEPLLRRKDISPDLMAEGYEAAALCLARMPQSQARKHFERLATNSVRLLEDEETPLVVKEGAGLLLCTLFELVDEAGETVDTTEATEMARQLSKESSKHKAKKDLKEQRAFFRRVYRFFDEGEVREMST